MYNFHKILHGRENRFSGINPVKALNVGEVRIDLSKSRKYANDREKELGTLSCNFILSNFPFCSGDEGEQEMSEVRTKSYA
jgi:hypothetical protein